VPIKGKGRAVTTRQESETGKGELILPPMQKSELTMLLKPQRKIELSGKRPRGMLMGSLAGTAIL